MNTKAHHRSSFNLSTVGKRAFPVAPTSGSGTVFHHTWPLQSAPSLAIFRRRLKTSIY